MSATSNECRLPGLPHFDFAITDKNVDTSAKVLISHIKKDWDVNKMHRKDFGDGKTNRLVGYYMDNGGFKVSTTFGEFGRSDIVLIRIYGAKTELLIDRVQELRNFSELALHDFASNLHCTFSNGYCYRFMEGRVLGESDFSDKFMINECAKLLGQLHSIELSENYLKYHPCKSHLFETLHRYIKLVPRQFKPETKQKQFEETIPKIEILKNEVECIKDAVGKLNNVQISFCHNDLLRENLIFDEHDEKLRCIDYEYSSPNYSAYDIGNNFNEFAGMDNIDYSLYPNKETQMSFLKTYLEEYKKAKGITDAVSEKEIHNLYVHVNQFALASHLFWGIWGLIQAHHSTIDFDYIEFANIRFTEYYSRKEEFLSLKEIS